MTTEVSEEIRKRIEQRRAARSGNAAAPAQTPVAEPVQPLAEQPAPEPALPVEASSQAKVEPAPTPPAGPKRQPRLEPQPDVVEQPISRAERITAAQPAQPAILSLLEGMRIGEAIVVHRETDATWHMSLYAHFVNGPKPKTAPTGKLPNGFAATLLNPAYAEWEQAWSQKTFEQKMEEGLKLGLNADDFVTEEEGKISPRLTLLKLVPAIRNKMGLPKYKPGFETITQRKEAEAKARVGEAWL